MHAYYAREITDKNLQGHVIEPFMTVIFTKIKIAAEAGRSSITHPFANSCVSAPYPTPEQQDAVWAALIANGYKVKHHPDPDPGHPASCPYTEIYW